MRVLQVIGCFARGGGAEKFVLDLSLALKKIGVEVEILSIVPPHTTNRDFCKILEANSIPIYFLTSGRLRSLKNFGRLCSFLKKHDYDVVHGHLFPALYFCGLNASRIKKLIYTEHSTDNRRRHIAIFKWLDYFVYRRYNKIVCISEKVRELLQNHIGQINSMVIPNGINLNALVKAKPLKREDFVSHAEGIRFIVMVARFVKGKDYLTLFRALKCLPTNIHLICVGTGELEEIHKKNCKEYGLINRVHFLGLRKDVERILKMADVIVLSSEHEGFSLSMLEAMASGNPFIASNVPGIVDLIKDYTELFPLGDEKILADIILRLLTNEEYRNDIVRKNQMFAKQYDILEVARRYSELYKIFD